MVRKLLIGMGIVLLVAGLSFGFFRGGVTGEVVLGEYHTQAICNATNFCQDFKIYCDGENVVALVTVEGATTWNDDNWTDPRGGKERGLCR